MSKSESKKSIPTAAEYREKCRELLKQKGYEDTLLTYNDQCERDPKDKQECEGCFLPDGRPTISYLGSVMDELWWEVRADDLESNPNFSKMFQVFSIEKIGEMYFEGYGQLLDEKYGKDREQFLNP